MAPQAVVNPEDLRRFARELNQFNKELLERMMLIQAQFKDLGDTWRDQEHEKFAQEFEQMIRVLRQFTRSTEQHIPFLLRKAERVDEYLRQR